MKASLRWLEELLGSTLQPADVRLSAQFVDAE